jgi:hypothetical protein
MKIDLYETITRLKKFKRERKSIEADLRHLVIDKDIPLKERWEIFIEAEMGDTVTDHNFPYVTMADMYNTMGIYRLDFYDVDEILELAIDCEVIFKDEQRIIDEFKEYCLENFITSIEFEL